jgi:tetrahydromethanopterin S-methyltransferase subunit B
VREAIEETLLLPMDEIEKRREKKEKGAEDWAKSMKSTTAL